MGFLTYFGIVATQDKGSYQAPEILNFILPLDLIKVEKMAIKELQISPSCVTQVFFIFTFIPHDSNYQWNLSYLCLIELSIR